MSLELDRFAELSQLGGLGRGVGHFGGLPRDSKLPPGSTADASARGGCVYGWKNMSMETYIMSWGQKKEGIVMPRFGY